MTRISLLLILVLSVAAQAAGPTAKQLNTEGFRAYQAKNYAEAIEKFRAATVADPKLALGWYNLAATLSLMRKLNKTCEFDAYRSTITDALKKAVELDKGRKIRMQKDPDLDSVRDTIVYQQLLGVNATAKDGLSKLLQNVTWWGPAPGAFGPAYGMKFLPEGKAAFWELTMDAEGNPKKTPLAGEWRVGKDVIDLSLPKSETQPARRLRGKFDGAAIVFDGSEMKLTDNPSECEA